MPEDDREGQPVLGDVFNYGGYDPTTGMYFDGTADDRAQTDQHSLALALWANQVQRDCLLESGGDVVAAFQAAGYILATQSPPEQFVVDASRLLQTRGAALAYDPAQPRDEMRRWTADPDKVVPHTPGTATGDGRSDGGTRSGSRRTSRRSADNERGGDWRDQHYSDDDGEWRVGDIADYMRDEEIPLVRIAVDFLAENNLQVRPGDRGVEKPGDPEFVRAAEATDLSHPILAVRYPDGVWICDGVHRLWKARARGMADVEVRLITKGELDSIPHDEGDEVGAGLSLEDVSEIHAALAAGTPRTVGEPFQGPSGRWFVVKEMPGGNKRVVPAKNPNAAAKPPGRGRKKPDAPASGGDGGPPPAQPPKVVKPPPPAKVVKEKFSADDTLKHIAELRAQGPIDAAAATELARRLAAHTVVELKDVLRKTGGKVSGLKAELVKRIGDWVASGAGKGEEVPEQKNPEQPTTPEPPAPPEQPKTPEPPAQLQGVKPGEQFMPDQPIWTRLANYTHGDEVVAKLVASGQHLKDAQVRYKTADARQQQASLELYQAQRTRQEAGLKREGKERYKELDKVLKEKGKAMDAADKEWQAARADMDAAEQRGRDAVRSALVVPDAHRLGGFTEDPDDMHGAELKPDQQKALQQGREWIDGVVARSGNDPALPDLVHTRALSLMGGVLSRSHYEQRGSSTTGQDIIRFDQTSNTVTAVHEYGHYLDHNLPGAKEAAKEFVQYRVGNETPTKLKDLFPDNNYDDSEHGRKDNFDKVFTGSGAYYAGKDYPGGYTEIVSMGVQELYRDAATFARNDPEYCKFIIGILHGNLRGGLTP